MGNKSSNIHKLHSRSQNNDNNSKTNENLQYEQLYRACESGDLNQVRNLMSHLPQTRINSIEYQGNSAIDAAAVNGHNNIVQYLLDYDYFRRPLTNPTTERQKQSMNFLLNRLLDPDGRYIERDLNECINFQPSFENVREHTTLDHAQAPQMLMRLANASRVVRPFIRLTVTQQCVTNLTQIINAIYRKYGDQYCNELRQLYVQFQGQNNVDALVEIYTLATPQMSTILRSNSGSYTALIYLNIHKFQNRAFNGISYRGLKESPLNLEHYRSAMERKHIVELNNLTSTSKSRQIADIYCDGKVNNAHLMVIKFDFTEKPCPTALDLTKDPCISRMPYEEEVLVLPHTLFYVTHIEHILPTQENLYERLIITLKCVPIIGGRTLNSFIWKRSRLE